MASLLRGQVGPLALLALLAAAAGCGEGGSDVTGVELARLSFAPVAGDGQSAVVHSTVAVPPSVRVTRVDRAGVVPVPGLEVVFQVTTGGGSVTGSGAITDADGVATVGSWVLGDHPGSNVLSVRVGGSTVTSFSATGLAGAPASIAKGVGDNQNGDVSALLPTAPEVAVKDFYGNPVPGVMVTFAVTSGGGEVYFGTKITDAAGTAQVGAWKLGPAPGPNTLDASIEGLPAVTFTANAVDRCGGAIPYTVGSTVEGTVSAQSCRLWSGEYTTLYSTSIGSATSLQLGMTSSDFLSHVSLLDHSGSVLATGSSFCDLSEYCDAPSASVRVLLAAGEYVVAAGGFWYNYDDEAVGGVAGSYTLTSNEVEEDVGTCSESVFIVPGVTTTQRIETTDCAESYTIRSSTYDYHYDRFGMFLTAGRSYTISMSSAEFDTYLTFGGIVSDDGSSSSEVTFTPTTSGVYSIKASTHSADVTGSYTITVGSGG